MSDMRLSGLASGIDTTSLIQQLMKVERRPIDLLQLNIGKNNKVLEALRNLNTKFQALEAAAKKVQELTNFAPNANATTGATTTEKAATVASPNLLGVAALPAGVTTGEYFIDIKSLAQKYVYKTGEISYQGNGQIDFDGSGTTGGGALSLRILKPNGTTAVSINFNKNSTIFQIRDAINAAGPLTASVESGKLVFTAKDTGGAHNFSLAIYDGTGGGTFNLLATRALGLLNGTTTPGTDAEIVVTHPDSSVETFRNASVLNTSPTPSVVSNNQFGANQTGVGGEALGFTLFAHSIGQTSVTIAERPVSGTVTINNNDDTNTTVGAIRDLFNKYNDVVKQLRADTAYNPATRTGGPLMGDPSVGRLMNELNRALTLPFTQVTTAQASGVPTGLELPTQHSGTGTFLPHNNTNFNSYVKVGVRVEKDGTVSVDESVLRAALTSNPNEVRRLFAFEDYQLSADGGRQVWQGGSSSTWGDGIATRLRAFANQSSSPLSLYNGILPNGLRAEGAILSRISAVDRQNATINENIQRQERRLVQRERLLRLQFQNMEKVLSGLKSQGSYLQGQFTNAGSGQ